MLALDLKHLKALVVLAGYLLVNCPYLVQGQSDYTGEIQLGTLRGHAEFSYKLVNADTVFDGVFRMEHGELDSLANGDNYYLLEGGYLNDIPQGEWIFRFGKLATSGPISLQEYQYQVPLDGTLHVARGVLEAGLYQGKWIQEIIGLERSEPTEVLFRSETEFDVGQARLAIRIEDGENVLLGRFLRNGLAHDIWTCFNENQQEENWHWKNGWLTRISSQNAGEDVALSVFADFSGSSEIVDLDSRYLAVIEAVLQLKGDPSLVTNGDLAKLALKNSQLYKKVSEVLLSKKSYQMPPPFQVLLPYQSLGRRQLSDIGQLQDIKSHVDSVRHEVMSSSTINIAKVTDEKISYWQAAIDLLSTQYLQPVSILLHYYEAEMLEFIPRALLWQYLWPDQRTESTVSIPFEIIGTEVTRSYTFPEFDSLRLLPGETGSVLQLASIVLTEVDSLYALIKAQIRSEADQDLVMETEERLIDTVQALNQLLDSLPKEGLMGQAVEKIRSYARGELTIYSGLNDPDAKVVQISNTLTCMTRLKHLSKQIRLIPIRWKLIEAEYTDRVWNNFTSTVMSEEVKRRITRSYRDVVVPHILELVTNELSCSNAVSLANALIQSYKRVHELRSAETTKLERRLKRVDDPESVMILMGVDQIILTKS